MKNTKQETTYKIYPIKKYAMTKENFAKFLQSGYEEYKLNDLCNTLVNTNKGYHTRIHPNETYIFFGDLDDFNKDITIFLNDIKTFLHQYYNIDIEINDIKYTKNNAKQGSYHYSIPKLYCSCEKLKEIHTYFKTIYEDNYKYKKNKIVKDCIDTSVYSEKWFRMPFQNKENIVDTDHKIINGTIRDFIVEYIPQNGTNIENKKFIKNITKDTGNKNSTKKDIVREKPVVSKSTSNSNVTKQKNNIINKNIDEELKKTKNHNLYSIYKQLFDKCFKAFRFDNYDEWIKIGMALKNVYDMDAFILFDYFSSKSKKYEGPEETLNKFNSFKYNYDKGYTTLTIYRCARDDNKDEYSKILYQNDVSFLENDFAKKIYEFANDRFIYKKVDDNVYKLYCFNGNYWECSDLLLRTYISTELYEYYKELFVNVYWGHPDAKKLKTQIDGLKKFTTKTNILNEYKEYGVKNIEFDDKWWLLGFNNKVLDLNTHTFRDYNINDYVSITTDYDWIEPTKKQIKTVEDIIEKVMPIKDERELYKQILSTALEGRCLEKFIVFNGNGRNGKGLTDEFVIMALGSYAMYANNAILFETAATGSNPELANLDKKRFVVFKEPTSRKKFENSMLKELTGGGKISARTHHEKKTQKSLHNTTICECNLKPALAEEPTTAEIERIIDIPFRSTFIQNETEIDENNYVFKADISLKSNEFRQAHKYALIKILLNSHIEYTINNFVLKVPATVKKRTQEYLEKSCDLLGWVRENYAITNDKNDIIKIKDLYEEFKGSEYWFNMSKIEKRKFNYTYFINYFSSNLVTKNFYQDELIHIIKGNRYHYRNILVEWIKINNENLFIDH
jgi:phage/plasmid-associated DNA primase